MVLSTCWSVKIRRGSHLYSKDQEWIYTGLRREVAQAFPSLHTAVAVPKLLRLSRADAKAVEQALIYLHGLKRNGGNLENAINSIGRFNPSHNESVSRGS